MTEVRYCLAPERCRTSTAGLSPNFGYALSVERGLETPMILGKGDGQDEDSWEDGRGRAVDELRTVLSCHEDIGMASELNGHFNWDWARGYVLCRSQFISSSKAVRYEICASECGERCHLNGITYSEVYG